MHIDYCFVPQAWTPRLRSADVADGRTWRTRSDHSPVVVDIVSWHDLLS
jgi:endonuclease/exonuclease/phosphatase family metal-dependent hydrolase